MPRKTRAERKEERKALQARLDERASLVKTPLPQVPDDNETVAVHGGTRASVIFNRAYFGG